MNSGIADARVEEQSDVRVAWRGLLATAMACVVALHAVLIAALQPHGIAVSRCFTVAVALLATTCVWLRGDRVPAIERAMLRWVSAGMFLWAAAHFVETVLGPPDAASSLAVDASDLIYIAAAFPLLLALSTTRETERHQSIFLLNCGQMGLAILLAFVLLFETPMTPQAASTAMGGIYAAECGLLIALTGLRFLAWTSREERRVIGSILAFLAAYLPVEIGMDYGTLHWNLHAGNLFDLLWSVPFCLAGYLVLYLPLDAKEAEPRVRPGRNRMLVGTLSPLLISTGVFALAASVVVPFPVFALVSIFLLLVVQGLEAGVVQRKFLSGQALLLERERDLREANATLEKLSQLDPLTNIPNRRRFDEALDLAGRRAIRQKKPIALLVIDLDYFKGINNVHGHSYGDVCLVSVARMLGMQANRPYDLLARYGGDEFFLLLPDTGANGAAAIADRIHEAIKKMKLDNHASPLGGRLTVSVGAGVSDGEFRIGVAALVDLADRALYEAKRRGRNQTCVRTPVSGPELVGGTSNATTQGEGL
ncbi:MAG: diguanylate cyclase domain-containing protein [Terracidiphilus sp.]